MDSGCRLWPDAGCRTRGCRMRLPWMPDASVKKIVDAGCRMTLHRAIHVNILSVLMPCPLAKLPVAVSSQIFFSLYIPFTQIISDLLHFH